MKDKCPEPVLMPDGTISLDACIRYFNHKYGFDKDTPRELEVAKLWGFKAEDFDENAEAYIDRYRFKRETVEIPKIKGTYSSCKVYLAQAPNGYWAVYFSIKLAREGRGAKPSIFNRTQYPDRQSALDAELSCVIKYCEKSQDPHAKKMLKILTDFKASQNAMEHPDLF
ncbi:MAG: hypothetical protein WCS27_06405 [Victivallaceae bacterium]|jgi:hypothetical protein